MKLIIVNKLVNMLYPIKEIYNNRDILLYEAHDEIECDFFSIRDA